jgi:hypothetical protein
VFSENWGGAWPPCHPPIPTLLARNVEVLLVFSGSCIPMNPKFLGIMAASYPGANNVLKIATLQCFYIDQWLSERAGVLGEDVGSESRRVLT